jgi:hypothetical protein
MKKWMYLIFPGIMLGLFLTFFLSHTKEVEVREAARLAAMNRKQADDLEMKKADEERARLDAAKNAAIRAKDEADKEAARVAKLAAQDKEVQDATDKALADAVASQKEIDRLIVELDQLHKQKDQLSREAFDVAKKVELAKVDRRNAELEIQRTTEMIVRRSGESFLNRLPPPPPPPPKT